MSEALFGSIKRPRRHYSLLTALVTLQAGAVVWVGHNGAFQAVKVRLRQLYPPPARVASLREWQMAVARDPKPGSRLPAVAARSSEGHGLSIGTARRPTGLLFINTCTNCVATRLAFWDRLQRYYPEVELYVVPMSPDIEAIAQFKQWHHLAIPFVVEGRNRLFAACNPYFLPRVYLFDRRGRLTYLQPPSISTEAALVHVRSAITVLATKQSVS